MMRSIPIVSVSGGKDSTATLLVALERKVEPTAIFCDTGNEHPLVYEYLDYLESATGVPINRLKADFSDWWWRKREYIATHWENGTGRVKEQVPADIVQRALAVFDAGPTGNPFLDLCIIKNRFPSRRSQFCTDYLKRRPAINFTAEVIAEHGAACSWQGVRADESLSRANLKEFEVVGDGYFIYRPIHKWSVADVFDQHRRHGIDPNPLYKLGMSRVGCMPCINVRKGELFAISHRFPEHIDRIEEWEQIVGRVSKRSNATFIPAPGKNSDAHERGNIRAMVAWSMTSHGGKQLDIEMVAASKEEPESCSSAYGLCE